MDGARLNLTYTRVTAPASGRVGLRLVDPGNIVSASSATGLVVVTQIEPIAVVFTLPEDALRIVLPRIRSRATLPVDVFDRSGTTRLASGTVVTLDNQIDPATGTVRVKAVFDNRDRTLFPRSSSTCSCSPTFGGDSSSYRPPPCSRDPRVHSCIPFAAETPSCSRSRRFQDQCQ